MEYSRNHKDFSEIIVKKLRDEIFEYFKENMSFAKKISSDEYGKIPRNPNLNKELQKLEDERFEFLNRLSKTDSEILGRLILNLLDSTAFNFLKEVEENLGEESGIGMTINGESIENITSEFLSGTLFGEYSLWIEKYSKYGGFQL